MKPLTQIARVTRPLYRQLSTTAPVASAPKPVPTTGFSFELNEEQKALQELARKFTKEEIIPVAAQYDKSGEYPWPIVKKAWEVGLMNGHIPEHCGGMELGVFDSCLVTEEIAFGCAGIKAALLTSNIGGSIPNLKNGNLDDFVLRHSVCPPVCQARPLFFAMAGESKLKFGNDMVIETRHRCR